MGSIITLLTDFGTRDHYVAAVKGVLLELLPGATVVDVSHEVPPHDVTQAAFLLANCWRDFPSGTVHLAVVDPGVGSERHPIAVSADNHYFVGPDNGVFTYIYRESGKWIAREIMPAGPRRRTLSATFHGRDIFAPAAAALAGDTPFDGMGSVIEKPNMLDLPRVEIEIGKISGAVIHIDRFGNLITNITQAHLVAAGISSGSMTVKLVGREITRSVDHYAEAPPGDVVGLVGSSGYYELAKRDGSAAEAVGAERGAKVLFRKSG
jgi:S-adenosylmethionine hydrolase